MPPVAIAPCDPRYPKTVPDPRRDRRFSEHAEADLDEELAIIALLMAA
jgi:hypothetical protein